MLYLCLFNSLPDLLQCLMIHHLADLVLAAHEDRPPEVLGEGAGLGVLHGVHPDPGVGVLRRHAHPPPAQTRLRPVHNHAWPDFRDDLYRVSTKQGYFTIVCGRG